jgi:hypothetical protein
MLEDIKVFKVWMVLFVMVGDDYVVGDVDESHLPISKCSDKEIIRRELGCSKRTVASQVTSIDASARRALEGDKTMELWNEKGPALLKKILKESS